MPEDQMVMIFKKMTPIVTVEKDQITKKNMALKKYLIS